MGAVTSGPCLFTTDCSALDWGTRGALFAPFIRNVVHGGHRLINPKGLTQFHWFSSSPCQTQQCGAKCPHTVHTSLRQRQEAILRKAPGPSLGHCQGPVAPQSCRRMNGAPGISSPSLEPACSFYCIIRAVYTMASHTDTAATDPNGRHTIPVRESAHSGAGHSQGLQHHLQGAL